MNERIFGLALQAMDFHGAVDTDTELKLTNDELKKFAELIIRECANHILNTSDRHRKEYFADKVLELLETK